MPNPGPDPDNELMDAKIAAAEARDAEVVIVGAGLAGLACACALQKKGVATVVLEAGDGVGAPPGCLLPDADAAPLLPFIRAAMHAQRPSHV